MYAFLFDRRSLTLLVVALVLVGVLMFIAGLAIGVRASLPEPGPAGAASLEAGATAGSTS